MTLDWNYIGRVSSIVTIAGGALGLVWFSVSISNRIEKLESQMQALATATAIQRTGSDGSNITIPNPIQQQCAALAARAAQERSLERSYTVDLLDRLGCRTAK